eukprot:4116377-Prymnesium_polylepis.1
MRKLLGRKAAAGAGPAPARPEGAGAAACGVAVDAGPAPAAAAEERVVPDRLVSSSAPSGGMARRTVILADALRESVGWVRELLSRVAEG